MNETPTTQDKTREETGNAFHTKAINSLAREWADYVGGFKQAQKIIRDAYELGLTNGALASSLTKGTENPKSLLGIIWRQEKK